MVLFLEIMSPPCYLALLVLSWFSLWERSPCGHEVWRSWMWGTGIPRGSKELVPMPGT